MSGGAAIARIAALVADPSRSMMLSALMGGVALTANELAAEAGVTASTASSHISLLVGAGVVVGLRQGRHRYFRLANEEVAADLEQLGAIASGPERRLRRIGPRDLALREARVCYDHFAGAVGVRIYRSLVTRNALALTPDGVALTEPGEAILKQIGVVGNIPHRRSTRLCLDWSERTYHLGGAVAAAVLSHFLDEDWVRRGPVRRQLEFTQAGNVMLERWFGSP